MRRDDPSRHAGPDPAPRNTKLEAGGPNDSGAEDALKAALNASFSPSFLGSAKERRKLAVRRFGQMKAAAEVQRFLDEVPKIAPNRIH